MKKNNPANTPEPMPINLDDTQPALWEFVISDFNKKYIGDEETKKDVIKLMKDRDAFGVLKYGVHLKTNNGRNFINDAIQEALDLAVYLKGIIEENKDNEIIKEKYWEVLDIIVQLYKISKKNKS